MATRKSTKAVIDDAPPVFDTSVLYRDILHQVEKLVGSSDNMDDVTPLSTGSVTHDLMLGGGILPAMYTNSGWEQTGKTTDALHAMASSISSDIDVIAFFDAEGSTRNSIPYLTNILRGAGVNLDKHELFGRKDSNGNVLQHGRVYYRTVTRGLVFFNWLAATLNRAPDKVRVNEKWYLKYPKTKEFAAYQKHHDSSTKRTDGIYIPAKHGGLAGIVFVDSWANLNPESKDTDDEDRALAAQARMFSAGLKRVKGLLASKKFAIYGINQLSAIPMAMFGPKEDEKGGNALKYNSDARTRFTQRALSGAPLWPTESKNRKGFEVERAIDGGIDAYRYVTMRTIKNKLAPAQREAWMRIWVRDSTGAGRGIDPVFDCVTGDTMISTSNGVMPIADLENYTVDALGNNVYSVEGLKALAHDGKMHKILNFQKKGTRQVYEITTQHGHRIKATGNHKFQVMSSDGHLHWRALSSIDLEQDYLVVAKEGTKFAKKPVKLQVQLPERQTYGRGTNQFVNTISDKLLVDCDLAYLWGYLLTDGTFAKNGKSIQLYSSNPKVVKHLVDLITRRFSIVPTVTSYIPSSSPNEAWIIVFARIDIWDAFYQAGILPVNSSEKQVPEVIFRSPKEVARAFLHGMLCGDGSFSKGDYVCFNSTSQNLLEGVARLAWMFGVTSNIGNNTIVWSGHLAKSYKELIGKCPVQPYTVRFKSVPIEATSKSHEEKTPVPTGKGYNLTFTRLLQTHEQRRRYIAKEYHDVAHTASSTVNNLIASGMRLSRVKSIVKLGYEPVYDIEVEGAHSFVANGIVVHNCIYYLYLTGQIIAGGRDARNNMRLNLDKKGLSEYLITWDDLKLWILGTKQQAAEICKSQGLKPFSLRAFCRHQVSTGRGEELYNMAESKASKPASAKDKEE